MNYREYRPSERLAAAVHCVWTLHGHATELGNEPQVIVPDGRPELVVHLGDRFERVHGAVVERQAPILFAGQLTGPLVLRPTGHIAIVGVRFHPHGAAALFAESQNAFAGLTIGVDSVSRTLFDSLADAIGASRTLGEARVAIEHRIAARLDCDRVDARVGHVVSMIQRTRGRVPVEQLAYRVGVTRRHLERQFNALVGLSPKRLARITRLQHALQTLSGNHGAGATTAASCGYADQAHFIRECHELTGQPPSAYLLERAELTGFFTERV